MTAPSRGRDDATIRGAVVLVVAIVVGLALLWRSGTGDDDKAGASASGDQSSTVAPLESSTDSSGNELPAVQDTDPAGPDDTQPAAMVTVIVFNGTPGRVAGLATEFKDKAAAGGYQTLKAADATATTETTTIYFAEGFELDAEAMRAVLDLPNAAVEAKPTESLGPEDALADIVVVLGGDYESGDDG